MKDKLLSIVGIIGGIVSLAFSASVYKLDVGSTVRQQTYGGDAYTGIQNAGATAATNIVYMNTILRTGLSALLAVIGIHMICYYTMHLLDSSQAKAIVNAAPQQLPAKPADQEYEEANKF